MRLFRERIQNFIRYQHLFWELVVKDVKLKYRRSFLGYVWSVLNPLLTMVIMVIVFSNMFRFDIENFSVYLIIGQTLFNFLSESTTQAIFSITGNAVLIKKTYVPKYIFTLARVTSSLVNLLFALGAIFLVFVFFKIKFTLLFLWIPLILLQEYVFCVGLGMFLAQGAVFFRDIQYIYGVLVTAWMYLTPIFYPLSALTEYLQKGIMTYNPMYFYITQFRQIVLESRAPQMELVVSGSLVAVIILFVGVWCFAKTQDKFVLYI